MLPQVKNINYIIFANDFLEMEHNGNEESFLEYLLQRNPEFNIKRDTKDAAKGLRYVKAQKSNNVDKFEWTVQSKYVYNKLQCLDDGENKIIDVNTKKRILNKIEIDECEPKPKIRKTKSIPSENDFIHKPNEVLLYKVDPLLEFPKSIMDSAHKIINDCNHQLMRILVRGPTKCGKSTFIKMLAKKYGFSYFTVPKIHIENMDCNKFESIISKFTEDHDKIIFHFNFNHYATKASSNFKCEIDEFPCNAKILLMFESTFPEQLKNWSDIVIEFPLLGKVERKKYLEQFFSQCQMDTDFSLDKMAQSTPGYQIGDVKKLYDFVNKRSDCSVFTEQQFNEIIYSGNVKNVFFDKSKVCWDDIGGHVEVKNELKKVINELLDEKSYRKPEGIILYGPPGCGKTMLAKALANELSFSFISLSCTDILSKYQGESEKNVKEAFDNARNSQPCILFIDEIDALCSERSNENSGSRNTIVNAFLIEIDGLSNISDHQLLVIGATNFMENIDAAISRNGRLGRHIEINIPKTPDQRVAVLMAASKNGTQPNFNSLTPEGNESISSLDIFREISQDQFTEGWSHSDLSSLIFEAENQMKNDNHFNNNYQFVTEKHLFSAYKMKNIQRKKKKISEKFSENTIVTYFEEIESDVLGFTFDDILMENLDIEISQENVIMIGGGRMSGKSTLIKQLAKNKGYNLVEMMPTYFKNFCIAKFWEEVSSFAKISGSSLFQIKENSIPKTVMCEIQNFIISDFPYKILVVFEKSGIDNCYLKIDKLTQEVRLKLVTEILNQFQFDKTFNLVRFLENSSSWQKFHFTKFESKLKSYGSKMNEEKFYEIVSHITSFFAE